MIKENFYETMFLLASDAFARNQEEITGKLEKTIESLGGKIRVSRLWEERKLAYPVKNRTRGVYWVIYYRITTDKLEELNLQFRLNTDVLRCLPLRLDPRLEEVLIQHTLAEPTAAAEGQESDVVDDEDDDEDEDEDDEVGDVF